MTDDSLDCRDRVDVLLLAAFGPELAPLKPAFASSPSSPARDPTAAPAGSMCGRIGSLSVRAEACGIGLSAAAAFSSLHLRETRPRAVVLLGTCGAYRSVRPQAGRELAIGDVVVSRRIVLVDWATVEGHAQFPPATAEPISSDERLSQSLARAGAAPADVANTLGITVKDDVAARIAKSTGTQVEHLEAYGVATASAASAIPFAAVLGVANGVGSAARGEWRSHHVRASEAVARLVLAWIETMAAEALAPRALRAGVRSP
jgi:nucleoside phosphorylase